MHVSNLSPRRFVRPLAAIAAALTLGLSAIAGAQPHGGAMHGPGGPESMMARALQAVKDRLNLNTSQQAMWDSAVADSKAARAAARTQRQRVHDALTAQLALPEPDFAAVARVADEVGAAIRDDHVKVRNEWLSLYGTFTTEQKAIVRDAIAQRLARMQQFKSRMQGRGPAG